MLPGFTTPAVGFDQPFEMLQACHERVQRSLRLLARLVSHLREQGCDAAARDAAADVLRYFDLAAPHHHEDEERHVFPPLLASGDAALVETVRRLQAEHAEMTRAWAAARPALQALATGARSSLDAEEESRLAYLGGLYAQHILTEETLAYPAAHRGLGAADLQRMGREMARRRGAPPPSS